MPNFDMQVKKRPDQCWHFDMEHTRYCVNEAMMHECIDRTCLYMRNLADGMSTS